YISLLSYSILFPYTTLFRSVTFDDSNMALDSLDTFHEKADALLVAHNCEIPEAAHDITGLQPKLKLLIQGHGAEFDDSNLDPNRDRKSTRLNSSHVSISYAV